MILKPLHSQLQNVHTAEISVEGKTAATEVVEVVKTFYLDYGINGLSSIFILHVNFSYFFILLYTYYMLASLRILRDTN